MPMSVGSNIVQSKAGTFTGTSGTASLDAGTTAGNAVVLICGVLGNNTASGWCVDLPTGFDEVTYPLSVDTWGGIGAFIKRVSSGGETSWTVPVLTGFQSGVPSSQTVIWAVLEMAGLDLDWSQAEALFPYRRTLDPVCTETAAASSFAGPAYGQSDTYDGLAITAFMIISPDTVMPVISSYGEGFDAYLEQGVATSPKACKLGIATKVINTVSNIGTTCNHAANNYANGHVMVFTSPSSKHAYPLQVCSGAEIGTATTLTNAPTLDQSVTAPWDEVIGTPAAVTTTPRTGNYCWELTSTAAAAALNWTDKNYQTGNGPMGSLNTFDGIGVVTWSERFHIYLPTLPTPDTPLWSAEVTSLANGVVLRYITASQKLGLKIGTGTERVSDAVVTAAQWIGVDVFYDPRTATHTCAWQIDYNATPGNATPPVVQTTASTAAMTAGRITKVRHGWTTAITATVRYDDIAGTRFRKAGLMGDVRIYPLKVDPVGTPSVSGTAANFKVFTANGTLATWTAAGTVAALDEIPFVIGASSDGLTQVTAATNDYVNVPMETFALAPNYVPLGVRWYWAGWAASTTQGTIFFRPDDGSNSFNAVGGVVLLDSQFDTTTMAWTVSMHTPDWQSNDHSVQLNQARIDALAARFGWSGDATPDVGVHGVLAELVVQPAVIYSVIEAEDGAFTVYVRQDSLSAGVVSYLVTTPAGTRGATFNYALAGVDQAPVVVAANTATTVSIGGQDITAVTSVGLTPDPSL